jgi:hypothetical protein
MTARFPRLAWLRRAILPAGGAAALLFVLAMAASAPPTARATGAPAQAETRDPGRPAVLRPQNPVPVVRRDDRAGDQRATPHYPVAAAPRPAASATPSFRAERLPARAVATLAAAPTKHVRARAPPAAA